MAESEVRRLAGQCLMVGVPGRELDGDFRRVLARHQIGNACLFARSTPDAVSTRRLTEQLQAFADAELGTPMLIATDHEGGRVQRLTRGATQLPGAMALGQAGPEHVAAVAEVAARELLAVGVNMVLAPVADVNLNPQNPVIGVRSFGQEPEQVAACVRAAVGAYRREGIVSCAKHFPGHGDTSADSHAVLPVLPFALERLERVELPPFEAAIAAEVDAVMVGHLALPALDRSGQAATLSPIVVSGLLRERLGYRGLICTDCMEMNGVAGPDQDAGEVAVRAFLAGADLVLLSHTPARYEAAARALSAAAEEGRIPIERLRTSAARVAACKLRLGPAADMAVLASPAHQQVVESAARAAVGGRPGAGPLPLGGKVGVMALDGGVHTQAEDVPHGDPFLDAAVGRGAALVTPDEPGSVDALLVGVRRPDQEQLALLRRLARAYPVAVVALREPYVLAELAKATTVAACDDTPAMVGAVLDLTLGRG